MPSPDPRPVVALALAVWALSVAPSSAAPEARTAPPNVLIVTVDTLRPDALGWVAGKNATPRIDELAAEGFRFPAAVSSVPLTLPAHTSIFSGLYPRHHGVRDNGQIVPRTTPLFAEILRAKGYATAAFVSGYPLRRMFGLDRGFDVYDDRLPVGAEGWLERRAPETAREAIAWLSGAPKDRPWLLWAHFYDPHDPYEPPPAFWRPGVLGNYYGEVAQVDESIGVLRDAVRARGGETVTLFTADHGEAFGEHGEHGHGFFVYDATIRVPVVVHAPGKVRAGTSSAAIRHVDLAPTLLALLGIAGPNGDGVSLLPRILGAGARTPTPEPALVESMQPWTTYGWAPLRALIDDDWKLIAAPRPELFDLAADPGESHDLIASERRRATALRDRLAALEERPAASRLHQ